MSLTATYHMVPLKELPADKFENFCFWLVEDSGEYQSVEDYGGPGDKSRDVLGITEDGESDFYQCKRYDSIGFSELKDELDKISSYIKDGKLKQPRRIYFVTTCSVSPDAKDKLKTYAISLNLPEPTFWGPVILDKKVKNNKQALKNFFNITEEKEEPSPQVDVTGFIAQSTQEYPFNIINSSDVPAADCTWALLGFNFKYAVRQVFYLKPGEEKGLKIAMPVDFMGQNPIKDLRLRFEFRDSKNNWYFSERYLEVEEVPSNAFFRIKAEPGEYKPARRLVKFSIELIESVNPVGLIKQRLVTFKYDSQEFYLLVKISHSAQLAFGFNDAEELEAAFEELARAKIEKMIASGQFQDELIITNDTLSAIESTNSGYELFSKLRDNI